MKAKIKKKVSDAPKKASARVKKQKKEMRQVNGWQCFWVNNGPVLRDLYELRDALREMSDDQYRHHAQDDRNDFSAWVFDVMGDEVCARSIMNSGSKDGAIQAIEECLKDYR